MIESREIICAKADGCTVLVVEDNSVDARILQLILERKNIKATYSNNGDQAWNLVNSIEPPDLVFLDLLLPGVNGFQLLRHIRSKPAWDRVPVVVVSAADDLEKVKEALNNGATGYIAKPYDLRRLRDEVNRFFISQAEHGE